MTNKKVYIVKIESDDDHIAGIDSVWDNEKSADKAADFQNKHYSAILTADALGYKILGKDDFEKWRKKEQSTLEEGEQR